MSSSDVSLPVKPAVAPSGPNDLPVLPEPLRNERLSGAQQFRQLLQTAQPDSAQPTRQPSPDAGRGEEGVAMEGSLAGQDRAERLQSRRHSGEKRAEDFQTGLGANGTAHLHDGVAQGLRSDRSASQPTDAPVVQRESLQAAMQAGQAPAAGSGPMTRGADLLQQRQWADAQQRAAPDAAAKLALSASQAPAQADTSLAAWQPAPPASADTPQAAGALRGADFAALLQQLCSQMYVATPTDAGSGRMMLDLGQAMPGSLVELVREGAFLRVRLHGGDAAARELMGEHRERLLSMLERSTGLGVAVDVVAPQ
jgi:hypothetical protein